MKTARDKAQKWMKDVGLDYVLAAPVYAAIEDSLVVLLKEQDRDTRHACAESVIQHGDAPALEMIDLCHNSCMNARAV